MSSSSQEPVCQRIQELRHRLDRIKSGWERAQSAGPTLGWSAFREEWQLGWQGIVASLAEIERKLSDSLFARNRETPHPAILRFPPAENGAAGMEAF